MPSSQATYDDASLILRLYELRREDKLREARSWFGANFWAATLEEVQQIAPPTSPQNAYVRMVVSYWDMAASFVTSGVLNQDLFFQSNGELLVVWERIRPLIAGLRERMKNPNMWKNLETVGEAYVKWVHTQGPEAYAAFQAMQASMAPKKEG